MFCSNKDKITEDLKSNAIYKFRCPGCSDEYIGKTDRNFRTRVLEHGSYRKDQNTNVYKHLSACKYYDEITSLFALPCGDNKRVCLNTPQHLIETAIDSINILARNDDWVQLCFLESLYIKREKPALNTGCKATKELQLFR